MNSKSRQREVKRFNGALTKFMMKYSSMERYTMKKTQDHGFRA